MKYGENPELDKRLSRGNATQLQEAALREIDYNKRWLDSLTYLQEVVICIKYDRKTGQPRFVHLTVETEREIVER